MTTITFRDERGNPVADAVTAITSAPAELTDIGYVTDDRGVLCLTVSVPGSYGFTLTAGDGRVLAASAALPVDGAIDVTAHAAA